MLVQLAHKITFVGLICNKSTYERFSVPESLAHALTILSYSIPWHPLNRFHSQNILGHSA
jgi:hypothetical protein